MAYLYNVKLISNKYVKDALPAIYGIGKNKALYICEQLGIGPNFHVKNLTDNQLDAIYNFIKDFIIIKSDLKKENLLNIKRLVNIKSYRGLRHSYGLPSRGQRTKTNARTRRKFTLRI